MNKHATAREALEETLSDMKKERDKMQNVLGSDERWIRGPYRQMRITGIKVINRLIKNVEEAYKNILKGDNGWHDVADYIPDEVCLDDWSAPFLCDVDGERYFAYYGFAYNGIDSEGFDKPCWYYYIFDEPVAITDKKAKVKLLKDMR